MTPKGTDEAMRWLREALADLDTAEYLKRGGRHNTACFQAQQAAEKALKAVLYAHDVEEPWGHSVDKLLREASTYEPSLNDLVRLGALVDKYYIPTRYPNGLPGGLPSQAYGEVDSNEALKHAVRIIDAVRRCME